MMDGEHQFCLSMGLAINPTKTEVIVFHRRPVDSELTWHVDDKLLPWSDSFGYLALISHQSRGMMQGGNGANYNLLLCDKYLLY